MPGQVRFGRHDQLLYSTDASNYQVEPIGVVVPDSVQSMVKVLDYCSGQGIPLLPRGGGTSLPGQCTNAALVLDHSAFCRRVLQVLPDERLCHVEPGIAVDELNRWLEANAPGLFFAPDPATSAQASIGGCIGNNAAGARSIRYGRTSENVVALDVALTSGQRFWLGAGAGRTSSAARKLAEDVSSLVHRHAPLIRERFPKTPRRNAGYALDAILAQLDRGIGPDDLDLCPLICGSEGTLAVVLGAKLKLHPVPRYKGLAIVSFESSTAAIDAVVAVLGTGPSAVELIDDVVLQAARGNAQCRQYMDLLEPVGGAAPCGVLYVEYQATDSAAQIQEAFARLRAVLPDAPMRQYQDASSRARAWALRKAGEPLLHGLSAHRKPLSFIEDNAVPVEKLARFVAGLKQIVTRHGTKAAYYAHASCGVLHVRPLLDLHDAEDRRHAREIAVEVADLARECGGVMSGEHGDGRARGPLLERFYGEQLIGAFRQLKSTFDPKGILNPGIIADSGPVESITENLRVRPGGRDLTFPEAQTYYDYSDQESFTGAVEMCNGAAVCRKTAGGVMCPSYRATMDERHSTRGRGNALRLAISGQLNHNAQAIWNDPETIATLDLCLSCKACKTECPSNVDIARLKADYTAQRYRQEGVPLAAKAFGNVRTLNRFGSLAPGLANWVMSSRPGRAILNRMLGLSSARSLPKFARSLYRWYAARPNTNATGPRVVLFADCFVTYNEPWIGQAAITLLEMLGYRVELPKVGCCGRAMISNGMLEEAIRTADATLTALAPFVVDPGVKAILVCEPSCLSAMKDDWLGLKLSTSMDLRQKIASRAMLAEDFVQRFWDEHPLKPQMADSPGDVLFHGHCHQKALWGEQSSTALLRRLAGDRLKVIGSSCCGLAGAFGYAAHRHDLSMEIGEMSLFGPIRAADANATIVAPGTSCRHQIRDGTSREALHPIQLASKLVRPAHRG